MANKYGNTAYFDTISKHTLANITQELTEFSEGLETNAIENSGVTETVGLTNTGNQINGNTRVEAANYTLLAADYFLRVIYTDTGTVTITLPTTLAATNRTIIIKDIDGNATNNNITIQTQGVETIDGESNWVINGDGDWLILYADGTNWLIIG